MARRLRVAGSLARRYAGTLANSEPDRLPDLLFSEASERSSIPAQDFLLKLTPGKEPGFPFLLSDPLKEHRGPKQATMKGERLAEVG